MKTVVIDDEPILVQALKVLLQKNFPQIEISGSAGSVSKAVELISSTKPDLVLLDIDIKEGTGFDVIDQLPALDSKIIFITAHDEHALKAFKYNAIDYIVKPIDPDEFRKAIQKGMTKENTLADLKAVLEHVKADSSDKIMLNSSNEIIPVFINDVVYIQADGSYCNVHIKSGKEILTTKSLKQYGELLGDNQFVRVNHSVIINTSLIEKYVKGSGGKVVLSSGDTFEVSRRRKTDLMKYLK